MTDSSHGEPKPPYGIFPAREKKATSSVFFFFSPLKASVSNGAVASGARPVVQSYSWREERGRGGCEEEDLNV